MRTQHTDHLLANKQPGLLNIGMRRHIYPPWDTHLRQVLIKFDPDEDVLFIDMRQAPEHPVSRVYFTFIFAIGTSGESSKGRCDRLIHREEWSQMSLTVLGIQKCRQVKTCLLHYVCALQCFCSRHYRMNSSIKNNPQYSFIKWICVARKSIFVPLMHGLVCSDHSLPVMKWCKKKMRALEKSGLTWLQKWDVRKTNSS